MRNKISKIFFGTCSYIGMLIPNVVTTIWLSLSKYSTTMALLFVLTTIGFIFQTIYFIHDQNLTSFKPDGILIALTVVLIINNVAMNIFKKIYFFAPIYFLTFSIAIITISFSIYLTFFKN